ncbi:carbohydrate binding domain-containing protein [bacterium]|nr:carbohydrate binding domain-containing protein [bacterium]
MRHFGMACLLIFGFGAAFSICAAPQGEALARIQVDENGHVQVLNLQDALPVASQKAMNPGPNLTYDPAGCSIAWNDPFLSISVRVTNNGTVRSGRCSLGYYLSHDQSISPSDHLIGSENIDELGQRSTFNGAIRKDISTVYGSWYAGFFIDDMNQVNEDDESDNGFCWGEPKIDIWQPMPDLIVSGIEVTDQMGPTIHCNVTVKNIGSVKAGSFYTRIGICYDPVSPAGAQMGLYVLTSGLNPGATEVIPDCHGQFCSFPGDYFVCAEVDKENDVLESNENNNVMIQTEDPLVITGCKSEDIYEWDMDVPKTDMPPVIDGIMDPVWHSVCSEPMGEISFFSATQPDNWTDAYASFKVMYDKHCLFLFIQANDDITNTAGSSGWDQDSFEVYFDGDNSKNDAATGYDGDDVHLRYIYGQTTDHLHGAPNSVCQFLDTDDGYNCEIRIPGNEVPFPLIPGQTFGFEIQFNDSDTGTRNHLLFWASDFGTAWQDPSLWGTARTIGYIASYPMRVLHVADPLDTSTDPSEEPAWDDLPWFSDNTFVRVNHGSPFSPHFAVTGLNGWNDCRMNYKMAWHNTKLYLYVRMYDDHFSYYNSNGILPADGFRILLDGNNDKTSTFDADDQLYDVNFGITVSDGYYHEDYEIDLGTDLGVTPAVGDLMGFDIFCNDNDGSSPDVQCQWYSNDVVASENPGLWGTIRFSAGMQRTSNSVKNGQFSEAMDGWLFNVKGSAEATGVVEDGVFHAMITKGGADLPDLVLQQKGIIIQNKPVSEGIIIQNMPVSLTFKAKSDAPKEIQVYLTAGQGVAKASEEPVLFSLDTTWQTYECSFTVETADSDSVEIGFCIGGSDADFYLDNVGLVESDANTSAPQEPAMPSETALSLNYPNPFNPSTTIRYVLQRRAFVELKVFNAFGQAVAVLVSGQKQAGSHEITWNARGMQSGLYLYRLRAGGFSKTGKMILMK